VSRENVCATFTHKSKTPGTSHWLRQLCTLYSASALNDALLCRQGGLRKKKKPKKKNFFFFFGNGDPAGVSVFQAGWGFGDLGSASISELCHDDLSPSDAFPCKPRTTAANDAPQQLTLRAMV